MQFMWALIKIVSKAADLDVNVVNYHQHAEKQIDYGLGEWSQLRRRIWY
jgi:hypothetical protein